MRAEIDQDRLRAAWDLWHYMARRWSDDFGTKTAPVRKSDAIRGLSPLKHAGLMLWALNKTQPIISIRFTGPAEPGAEEALYVAYPNEYVVFWFVYHVFFLTEMRRDTPKMNRPSTIMTDHYAHSMCKLLRFETPSAFSLYLIFKSFDLYMLPPRFE